MATPVLKVKLEFVALGRVVMQGEKFIAKAASVTMARRISNALNRYTPNPKGV